MCALHNQCDCPREYKITVTDDSGSIVTVSQVAGCLTVYTVTHLEDCPRSISIDLATKTADTIEVKETLGLEADS